MKKGLFKSMLTAIAAGALAIGITVLAFADTVVISSSGTNIRSSASTSSNVVTQAEAGAEYTITDTVTGDDGNTWYKISVNGSTGYVRSDLCSVKKDESKPADTEPSTATSQEPTTPTAIAEKTATVTGNDPVNIRSGAGTSYDKVGSLQPGVTITLIGEANDASGKKWYQFKCQAPQLEGYIRSDFVNITEEAQAPDTQLEEENFDDEYSDTEGTTGEDEYIEGELDDYSTPSANNDYEIVYTTDDAGEYQYYLYNHIDNTRQKVVDLLGAISTLNTNYAEVSGKLTLFKVLTIVFGVLMVVFIGLAIVLFIRLRSDSDDYYDDDDEDYDDDDDYEEEPKKQVKAPRAPRAEDIEITAQKEPQRAKKPQPIDEDEIELRPRTPRRPIENEAPKRPRKPQNFLADDDEFEFEFLNMDDKDN